MANLRSSMPNPGNKRARRGRSFRCASAGRATPHAARTKPATGLHKPVSKPPAAPTRPPEPTCQLSYGLCNPGNALPSRHMAPEPPKEHPRSCLPRCRREELSGACAKQRVGPILLFCRCFLQNAGSEAHCAYISAQLCKLGLYPYISTSLSY